MTIDAIERVVFDCNVFAQALINPSGAGGRCVELVLAGRLRLHWSSYVLAEIQRIPDKPTPTKLGVTTDHVQRLLSHLIPIAIRIDNPPVVYEHPIDPKDSHYVNLAVATGSTVITSSDKHLLRLNDQARAEGVDFMRQFPAIRIIKPIDLLSKLQNQPTPPAS